MSSRELHPAYLAAAPEYRWKGDTLKKLFEYLERTAAGQAPNWAGVILPGGARVAMRAPVDRPRELMIYRRERHTTPEGSTKWISELVTFSREFGILAWKRDHSVTPQGGPKVVFTETVRPLDFFGE